MQSAANLAYTEPLEQERSPTQLLGQGIPSKATVVGGQRSQLNNHGRPVQDQRSCHSAETATSPQLSCERTSSTHSTEPNMSSSHSSRGTDHHGLGTPMQLLKRERSPSEHDAATDPEDMPTREAALDTLITDISSFVQNLEKIISLQVSIQQTRNTVTQSRQNVFKADEDLAKAIRTSRDKQTVLDREHLLSLFDACQQARDELGPLEDDFQTTDFHLVAEEDDLIERGEEIKQKYEALPKPVSETDDANHLSKHSSARSWIMHQTQRTPITRQPIPNAEEEKSDQRIETQPCHNVQKAPNTLPHRIEHLPPEVLDVEERQTEETKRKPTYEPLIHQIAPDLALEPPWTQWTQFARTPDNEELSPYVIEKELSDLEAQKTDIIEEDDGLVLGNTVAMRCPFLKELDIIESAHGRVNLWLLYGLRTSRLEIRKFQDVATVETKKGLKWSEITKFWDVDEAAVAKSPPGSWLYAGSDSRIIDDYSEDSTSSFDLPQGGSLYGKPPTWYYTEQTFLEGLNLSASEFSTRHFSTPALLPNG